MPRVRVLFEPRDLWVGLFWDRDPAVAYLCLVPMFPVRVEWRKK